MTSPSTVTFTVIEGVGSVPLWPPRPSGDLAAGPGFASVHRHIHHGVLPSGLSPAHQCSWTDFSLLEGWKPTPFTVA